MKASASNVEEPNLMTGLFNDRESAERAYHALSERGYGEKDINVVMSDDTREKYFSGPGATETELGNKAAEGAGVGGAVGGTVVGIAAAVAAIGSSIAVPGLGLVIAGPLAAGLAGAGAGAGAGGLIGALVGWNIPEERVKHYEVGIERGGILMGVTPRSTDDATYLENEWNDSRGEQIRRS